METPSISEGRTHPPPSAKWVDIQQKTFTNWVNEQLRPTGEQVHDLRIDFCDGLKLISLVEVLQNKAGGPGPSRRLRRIRSPVNQHQCLENVQVALNAIAADNIKLVNIGSQTRHWRFDFEEVFE
ncbi:filamin-A-like [Tropilaelaps mercedesae]|uniref:Filamin-A-like n=1 Tax=Tropilaelaps mercedesae TaxID=418985 RepID=A0A1V9XTW2_9ACAR|nr:filamin-A-like [Tropilaelaps mercedesae]